MRMMEWVRLLFWKTQKRKASNYTMNEKSDEQRHRLLNALMINPKNLPG